MDRSDALVYWEQMEARTYTEPEPPPDMRQPYVAPAFDVTLRAYSTPDDDRAYTVRVAPTTWTETEDWIAALTLAEGMGLSVTFNNSAAEVS